MSLTASSERVKKGGGNKQQKCLNLKFKKSKKETTESTNGYKRSEACAKVVYLFIYLLSGQLLRSENINENSKAGFCCYAVGAGQLCLVGTTICELSSRGAAVAVYRASTGSVADSDRACLFVFIYLFSSLCRACNCKCNSCFAVSWTRPVDDWLADWLQTRGCLVYLTRSCLIEWRLGADKISHADTHTPRSCCCCLPFLG